MSEFDKAVTAPQTRPHLAVNTLSRKAFIVASLCAVFLLLAPSAHAQNGFIREVYTNVFAFNGIDGLLNHPSFPDSPATVELLEDFETPANYADFYGQRVRGYLIPPTTGDYTFWIAANFASQLWLSTDEDPANKREIAWNDFSVPPRFWDQLATQQSQPLQLEADRMYYIEALMIETTGSDHLAVRWQLPDGTIEEPIPGSRSLAELIPPQITRQPANVRVTEGQPALFSVQLANRSGVKAQWQRNGVDLLGETNQTLFLPATRIADSGSRYRVVLVNQFGQAQSTEAVLTVDRDLVAPLILSAQNPGRADAVAITFSKPVDPVSATRLSNYQVFDGITVLGATLDPSGQIVLLQTSPQTLGGSYAVVVSNIRDRADQPNEIDPDSRAEFSYQVVSLPTATVYGGRERLGPSTRRSGLVISEIMFAPAVRTDARNLEYIELHNSNPFTETIGGYRLRGDINYTLPDGVFIPPHGFLVVAPVPSDIQIVYGVPRVYGGYAESLPNGQGTVRLENAHGAHLFEVNYDTGGGWPVAADEAGHSMILSRPTYGEKDPRAWSVSSFIGGSPGRAEPAAPTGYEGIVINEFLANSDLPAVDFIELFNYGAQPVDLSGVWISDTPNSDKYQVPAGTVVPALGYVSFTETQLGFALSSGGERIIVRNPIKTHVITALRFAAQAAGVASGRFPDGSPEIRLLAAPTPGVANRERRLSPVVINEIMYNPVSGDGDLEYVELFNRSGQAVDIGGWRLGDGISHTFASPTVLPAGGFAVVAKDLAKLRASHPQLTAANSFGNFNGQLANDGERITLSMPQITPSAGSTPAVTDYVVVNEVAYGTGGRWGEWADGGGSSLELVDPDADPAFASNWADSDETAKGTWTTIERRGILDHGMTNFTAVNPSRNVHVLLMDKGEALLDNVQVVLDGNTTNLVSNAGFTQGLRDWLSGGTHDDSVLNQTEGNGTPNSLHIRAAARGDTSANRIRGRLTQGVTNGMIATIRADVKWLRGTPEILVRIHGNYLEAAGRMALPSNLGTPGAANSRRVANAGPAIAHVTHSPVLPPPGETIRVSAQVDDPDGLALVSVRYRIDPSTNYSVLPMVYSGAGYYSASIPEQTNGTMVAFYVEAADSVGASARFPAAAPVQEALVRVGETRPANSTLGMYRIWVSHRTLDRWTRREQASNKPLDATFVYDDERVIYNAGALYSGSPFHWGGYNGPLGNFCNYLLIAPEDDLFLGQTDFVLNLPSNIASDSTGVREQVFFWMADQMGQPANYRRYHYLSLNGVDRNAGLVFEDAQQPSSDFIEQWYPNAAEGVLHKIEDWFEYNDTFGFGNLDAELIALTTTNLATGLPELKQERYRWWFRKRAVNDSHHDYSELLRLVEAANTPNQEQFTARLKELIDVDQWMAVMALRHASGDWDAFGYRRGKNMYAYKPTGGKWTLMHWDNAFSFGLGDGTTADLFDVAHFDGTIDKVTQRMFNATIEFRRSYLRALYEIAHGPFVPSRVNPIIDARHQALLANGVPVSPADTVKDWIADRRQYILSQVASVGSGFAITINNGNNFGTNRNTLVLSGNAPVQVKTIQVNGVEYPITWKDITAWEIRVALRPGQNLLRVEGFDQTGQAVGQATDTISVNYTGNPDAFSGRVVFNEIAYNPSNPGAEFVELHNTSRTTAFDLSGNRINGLDFVFDPGTVIVPGGFLVVVGDPVAFGEAYGYTIPIAGSFSGSTLDDEGETLSLISADGQTVLAAVRYDSVAPWPSGPLGAPVSLQVVDPAQDTTRVGNWAMHVGNATPGAANSVRASFTPFPRLWVNELVASNLNGPADAAGDRDPWVELYNSGATAVSLTGMYLTDDYAQPTKWAFPAGASIAPGQFVVVWLDNEPGESTPAQWHANFRLPAGTGSVGLAGLQNGQPVVFDYISYEALPAARAYGAYPDGQAVLRQLFFTATPGAANNASPGPVSVFINEWMASNVSTIPDPDDGDYDDWFELYNAGAGAVDLSGYSLTDDLERPGQFVIPNGVTIPAGGYLLVWADSESADNGDLHASFRLSAEGDTIGLFAPNGTLVDSVTFGEQDGDESMGRVPNGGAEIQTLAVPTPGTANGGTPAAGLRFSAVAAANGTLTMTWVSEAATSYRIEYKAELADAAWTALTTVNATGASSTATDTINQARRFYRIVEL